MTDLNLKQTDLEHFLDSHNCLNPKLIIDDEIIVILPMVKLPNRPYVFSHSYFTIEGKFKYHTVYN